MATKRSKRGRTGTAFAAARARVNTLNVDPTRTGLLRRAFGAKLGAAFARLRAEVADLVADRDVFGLAAPVDRSASVTLGVLTANDSHESGAIMLPVEDPAVRSALKGVQSRLDPADVIELEDYPHVTVLYGIHHAAGMARRVQWVLGGEGPVAARMAGLSLFRRPDYDVLKYAVTSPVLARLNHRAGLIPNTQTFPDYVPHITVAYLKPGTGDKYLDGYDPVKGQTLMFQAGVYSDPDGQMESVTLNLFNPRQARDAFGRFAHGAGGRVVGRLKALGAHAHMIEHAVKDKIVEALARLPGPVQKALSATYVGMFATWTTSQILAERVARERGATPDQAKKLRAVLGATDLTLMKPVQLGLASSGLGAALIGAASLVPPATAGYLLYSTARNPLATWRAARGLARDGWAGAKAAGRTLGGKFRRRPGATANSDLTANTDQEDNARLILDELDRHGYDDGYLALLLACLDETQDMAAALELADELFPDMPDDPQPQDGDAASVALASNSAPGVVPGVRAAPAANALTDPHPDTPGVKQWVGRPNPEKLAEFEKWLRRRMGKLITGNTNEALWQEYIRQGFLKGAGRTYDDATRNVNPAETLDFTSQSREQFLRTSFANPAAVETLQTLVGRTLTELRGVTENMARTMTRVLADGLVRGAGPREVARDLTRQVDGLGRRQALTVARTELIRAHAEGQLTAMDKLGIQTVGAAVEWDTAGDGRVCPACSPLQGVVLTTNEARGMLPRHPNCRCAWVPSGVGEDTTNQKATRGRILAALKRSRAAGGGKWGPGRPIAKTRPTANASGPQPLATPLPNPFPTAAPPPVPGLPALLGDADGGPWLTDIIGNRFNPNQPRDAFGRFGSGGHGPALSIKQEVDKLSKWGAKPEEVESYRKMSAIRDQLYHRVKNGTATESEKEQFTKADELRRRIKEAVKGRYDAGDKPPPPPPPPDPKPPEPPLPPPPPPEPPKGKKGKAGPPPLDLMQARPDDPVAKRLAADAETLRLMAEFVNRNANNTKDASYNRSKDPTAIKMDKAAEAWGKENDPAKREKLTKRLEKLRQQYDKEWGKRNSFDAEARIEDARRNLLDTFGAKEPVRIDARMNTGLTTAQRPHSGDYDDHLYQFNPTPTQSQGIDKALTFFKTLTERAAIQHVLDTDTTSSTEPHPVYFGGTHAKRAYYSNYAGTVGGYEGPTQHVKKFIAVHPDMNGLKDITETNAHELGHWLEYNRVGLLKASKEFADYRCGDEPLVDMGRQRGIRSMYGEMGRKDNFDRAIPEYAAYYVGKDYRGSATEVVSVGLEYLYKDPVKFMKKDPEYALFVIRALQGRHDA